MPSLPPRRGPRPQTTTSIPHKQIDQQPDSERFSRDAVSEATSWPQVRLEPSGISVEGAAALVLKDGASVGPPEALLVDREFAHLHAQGDHSFHLTLPLDLATEAIDQGWAEPHFLVRAGQLPATVVMVYAPRDAGECDVVTALLLSSYKFAHALKPVRS